jgi:4-amino-4-deoxy-L-arabinose transferase-like glycosyltransferase
MTTVVPDQILPTDPPVGSPADSPPTSRWRRAVRGRESDPSWVRPTLLALLAGTALLYLVGLGASGWANSFYSAAVQAGSSSWKAFFFGSFDSSNFITVDKPPGSLWVMDISARLFGVNAWSILVPQALEGVAAVGLLYATVRRRFGAGAGLIAGMVLATTPVATLMFRFNNPDALLLLLLVAAAYAVTRAVEAASVRWLVLAGALIGFGFLTKMLQAFLVVPGFGLVYLVYARATLRRRIVHLLAAAVAIVVAGGWWVAAVMLTPASARPYVGGSTTNSVLQLAFGYNGFGRLTGNETGSVGGGGPGGSLWGATGLTRLFGSDMGGQISWLLPAALILGAATAWALRRGGRRVGGQRAQLLLWGSWLVVTGLVFSFGQGIIHPYYTVALAPAVGALVGIGAVSLWRRREEIWCRAVLAATLAVTVVWAHQLLGRSPSWHPALARFVLVAGLILSASLLVPPSALRSRRTAIGAVLATAGLVVGLAAPAAYSLETASTAQTGAIPSAGPTVTGAGFGGPGGRQVGRAAGVPGAGNGGFAGAPGGLAGGFGPGTPLAPGSTTGIPGLGAAGATGNRGLGGAPAAGGGAAGRGGGLLGASSVSSALTAALRTNASSYTWVAATVGAENASGYQLAADKPVMAIGGFNGTDNAPTLEQFKTYVAAGKIHYFIADGGGGFGGRSQGGSNASSAIASWVAANYTATTIGGTTVYDLTSSASS